jgi:hypothetical protein
VARLVAWGQTRVSPSLAGIAVRDERLAVALTVFCVAIVVYAATLLRGVSSFDAAEMQTVPTLLGIAHPTGYPLWTLIGFLWTKLFFFASAALMMNLLSAFCFALAAATLAVLCVRLDVRPVLAVVAGLTFAFAGETWARATQAEVHSLHTLLVALLLLAWVVAEQTESRGAARAMILVAAIGVAHHRLMVITALPLVLWFFARHLSVLRSKSFLVSSIACLTPLLVYLYIPIRADDHPSVVASDTSHGSLPIIRGDLFASHEDAFALESPSRWWDALPSYAHLAAHWLGWLVVLLALVGAVRCAARRPAIFVGLAAVTFTTTWGLANRTDRDYRWLIVSLFILCLLAALALEAATLMIGRALQRDRKVWQPMLPALAVLIPLVALVSHFSTYDRSADRRDTENGERILSAVAPNAVIWSYWDVRTTLQYLTRVQGFRSDVSVLDHGVYGKYQSTDDAVIAVDVAQDPSLAHRPYYFVPPSPQEQAQAAQSLSLEPVVSVDLPFGFDYRGSGWLYRVRR